VVPAIFQIAAREQSIQTKLKYKHASISASHDRGTIQAQVISSEMLLGSQTGFLSSTLQALPLHLHQLLDVKARNHLHLALRAADPLYQPIMSIMRNQYLCKFGTLLLNGVYPSKERGCCCLFLIGFENFVFGGLSFSSV
jgi:hypothetical protein